MARTDKNTLLVDWLFSITLVFVLGVFSHWVLEPQVGIDDANITQAYARNIALGYGYVYNIGGERVEGSTSALWTAINVLGFYLLEKPYFLLALINGALCSLMVLLGLRTVRILLAEDCNRPVRGLYSIATFGFVAFPAFFGWMIWSLMDTTIWAALLTSHLFLALVLFNNFQKTGALRRRDVVLYISSAAVLPFCRPEGIALAVGVGLVFIILWAVFAKTRFVWTPVLAISAALLSTAALSWARLQYFGFPQPNTFYAKVSDDYISQAIAGVRYTGGYFEQLNNMLLFLGAAIGIGFCILLPKEFSRQRTAAFYGALVSATVAGALVVYSLLGGDHFGSHRFYLIFVPLLMPFFIAAILTGYSLLANTLGQFNTAPLFRFAVFLPLVAVALLFTVVPLTIFAATSGSFGGEFDLAETGRDKGRILRDYPGDPSLGVVAAGGVRMGYDGEIYDLLGLNWVAMAMAEHNTSQKPKNHGGFNAGVFFEHKIDIVDPRWYECNEEKFTSSIFTSRILEGLFQNPDFQHAYRFDCLRGLAFFVRKDFSSLED